MDAIRTGNFDTLPGLATKAVYKIFPESDETQKGHMEGQRQNFRSTKAKSEQENTPPPVATKIEQGMFVKIVDLKETMYSDQTGKFPYLSSRGMRYIMVAYHTDPNYIFAEPMRNRTERQMIDAYNKIVKKMKAGGLGIKHHTLDNEISAEYKEAIKNNGATHQLVPPGDHRQNMVERAIQTFKDHFIGVLAPQVCTTLFRCIYGAASSNQLKCNSISYVNPTSHPKSQPMPIYTVTTILLKQPLAPLGCPVLAHEKPDKRGTWSDYAIDAWNLGTSMEHHRCFKCYSKTTREQKE
ncbi:hypothetical protein ACHAXR_002951 [Thalassiosira sp. AJA248-18]